MRASTQSVTYTLWLRSRVRTVSRNKVAWWPESGATTSTVGCCFMLASSSGRSLKRLKRSRRQNGLASTSRSMIGSEWPVDFNVVEIPGGLFVGLAEPVEKLVAGGEPIGAGQRSPQGIGIGEHLDVRTRLVDPRRQQIAGQLMKLIKHSRP